VLVIFIIVILPYRVWAGAGETIVTTESCLPGQPCFLAHDQPDSSMFRKDWEQIDNPRTDGWDTEVFNNLAEKQLKKIGEMVIHPENLDAEHAAGLVIDGFFTTGLFVEKPEEVFRDGEITIGRGIPADPSAEKTAGYKGKEGFIVSLQDLTALFGDAAELRFKFKLFRVRKDGDMVFTRQYFAVSGVTADGVLEQNATWDISWVPQQSGLPEIATIAVVDFEEVRGVSGRGKLFQDITESVLHKNDSYRNQILHGYPEFLTSIENTLEFNIFGTPGLAVGDVDGDGLDDLYVCQEQGLPNLLYLQNRDGSATDISDSAGVNWLESSRSALLLDFDNDGDQDLAVAMPGAVIVSANDGRGKFERVAVLMVDDDPMSMAAADYDGDGDVDLYVTLYNPDRMTGNGDSPGRSFVYHDADNGPANVLFRNDVSAGAWVFTDVTENSGLDVDNSRFSLSAAWEDYDNDGDQDLYVANDYGRDNLYRNDTIPGADARFVDVSAAASVEDSAGSMGIAWGDYDRDGLMDAFISAMWSSAGNRITFQDTFKPRSPEVKSRLQRFAHGNTMLRNRGDGTFTDTSEATGTEMGRWAWSSNFVDINNDGWEDLVVANGFLTGDEKGGDL
jgi:hypothetical protein